VEHKLLNDVKIEGGKRVKFFISIAWRVGEERGGWGQKLILSKNLLIIVRDPLEHWGQLFERKVGFGGNGKRGPWEGFAFSKLGPIKKGAGSHPLGLLGHSVSLQ